ncbi:MAG: DUF3459 domain-containing protein [Actinobacteria bacterium]|nr:DUF3459 domain-containing protein [Actinomycetota bacterium]
MADDPNAWWREGVLYQVYPRSYMDADGDGVGDLRGVIDRLDHLQWLGVRGIWLSPITVSPNADFGYDCADYCDVDPSLGTLADADELIAEAGRRGIRVLLDLVPNHTSIEHAWFREARASRDNPKRHWYVWADPAPDGGPPNNWTASFGGPAWTLDETTGQYYLHNFLPAQPDLNWWNEDVRAAFDDILQFWFDRGVAGFRVDVAHMMVKDAQLRDNPPAQDGDPFMYRMLGQRPVHNWCQPEVHEVHRRLRAVAESYDPPRLLVGETFLVEIEDVLKFYEGGDQFQLSFNIPFAHCSFDAAVLADAIERTERGLPPGATPVWTGSNHDISRFPSRWGGGDPDRARCALVMLLTLRGTVFLYEGDEIGMVDTPLEYAQMLDPVGLKFWPYAGRDPVRTPMQWANVPGGGFTRAGVEPWLPFGDLACNVGEQRHDPDSFLSLCRDLVALRDALADLRAGAFTPLGAPDGVLAYRRGERVVVAINLGATTATVEGAAGVVRCCTDRARDGERVDGAMPLPPSTAAVVLTDAP